MNPRFPAAAAALLLLSACATEPLSNAEATIVPTERILEAKFLKPSDKTGEVTIKRDRGFSGSGCSSRVFVNGAAVADISTAEKIVLHLKEGDHILSASPNGICGGGMAEIKANVKAGSQSSYRLRYGGAGDFSITPTAF